MKYLKKFSNHNGYDSFINTDKFIRPNVSICKEELHVHLNHILPHDYSNDYFTIESLEDNNDISIIYTNSSSNPMDLQSYPVYYSKNNGNWTLYSSTINLNTGDTLRLYSNLYVHYIISSDGKAEYYRRYSSTKTCNIYGNIMSLFYQTEFNDKTQFNVSSSDHRPCCSMFYNSLKVIDASNLILPSTLTEYCYDQMFQGCTSLITAPELPATTLKKCCYYQMFKGCTSLKTAPELPATTLTTECYSRMFQDCTSLTTAPELPATTLANFCYYQMFYGCTSLTTAPELPATTLTEYCYYGMFSDCTLLTTAPELPATTLANYCYHTMFCRCTSLTTAPELPATTLANYCYSSMFYGCTSLNSVMMLATNISAYNCLNGWLTNVAESGTFIKDPSMTKLPSGSSGIPSGWVVQDYIES